MSTRTPVVFSQVPCFLNFLFEILVLQCFSIVFKEFFFFIGDRHINEQAMTTMTGLFALISCLSGLECPRVVTIVFNSSNNSNGNDNDFFIDMSFFFLIERNFFLIEIIKLKRNYYYYYYYCPHIMAVFILRTHYPSGRTWANILLFVWVMRL